MALSRAPQRQEPAPQQQHGGGGSSSTSAGEGAQLAEESADLRIEGHSMQGASIELNLRFEDTVRKLEGSGDREARDAMLQLTREFKRLNDGLVKRLARISIINRTLVEILEKSQDGKAALTMRKAAELLVKGLANAEEEVNSLKATLREVEGQRDHYKALLAKTNAELENSHAYTQMSAAIGKNPDFSSLATASAATSSHPGGAAATGVDTSGMRRHTGQGKGPARRGQRQKTTAAAGASASASRTISAGGGGSGDGSVRNSGVSESPGGTSATQGGDQCSSAVAPPGTARSAGKIKGQAAAAPAAAAEGSRAFESGAAGWKKGRFAAAAGGDVAGADSTASADRISRTRKKEAAAAVSVSAAGSGGCGASKGGCDASKRRQRGAPGSIGAPGSNIGSANNEEGAGEQEDGRRGGGKGDSVSHEIGSFEDRDKESNEGSRRTISRLAGARGGIRPGASTGSSQDRLRVVKVPVPAVEPDACSGGGDGMGGSGEVGASRGDDGSDLNSVYDSDDAPSMFF